MPSREERLAQNEVRFREINEAAQPQRETQGEGRFVCECADRSCMAWIEVNLDEYAAVRRHPRWFIVAPSHEIPDMETVVDRKPGHFVIEKPESVPAPTGVTVTPFGVICAHGHRTAGTAGGRGA